MFIWSFVPKECLFPLIPYEFVWESPKGVMAEDDDVDPPEDIIIWCSAIKGDNNADELADTGETDMAEIPSSSNSLSIGRQIGFEVNIDEEEEEWVVGVYGTDANWEGDK